MIHYIIVKAYFRANFYDFTLIKKIIFYAKYFADFCQNCTKFIG